MIGEKAMNDIAYVIAKNIQLKALNLNDNVIDAKATLVLAKALKTNSNLQELDLRKNKLKNAGIAELMQIFIIQQKQRRQRKIERDNGVKLSESEQKKRKEEKFKMKMQKIFLDEN
jgi:Ran GTPase-activating protein (RanGAP) involved in mRNA processing and transport